MSSQSIERLNIDLKEVTLEWENAGSATEGDAWNKKQLLEKKLQRLKDTSPPEKHHVNIYILTGLKKDIKENIGDILSKKLPDQRNGETYKVWIPYQAERKSIEELLAEFKKKEGYSFTPIYIEENFEKQLLVEIDKSITENKVVAVIDLLALNEQNSKIALRFDTCKMQQILLPICEELHNDLCKYMKEQRAKVFEVAETRLSSNDCNFFSAPRENRFFIQQLKNCFPAKEKIVNSIGGLESDLNGLNNKFS